MTKQSSPRPTYNACPLPRSASNNFPGSAAACRADRHRPFERRHRGSERFFELRVRGQPPRHEGRDDLGVGRDLRREPQAFERLEIGVVVDVTVERGGHVGPAVVRKLFLVQGVRVRLGDDADARPPRVREHRGLRGLRPQREAQQVVVADLGAERAVLSPSSPISAAVL